jgi:hypothetical protein
MNIFNYQVTNSGPFGHASGKTTLEGDSCYNYMNFPPDDFGTCSPTPVLPAQSEIKPSANPHKTRFLLVNSGGRVTGSLSSVILYNCNGQEACDLSAGGFGRIKPGVYFSR